MKRIPLRNQKGEVAVKIGKFRVEKIYTELPRFRRVSIDNLEDFRWQAAKWKGDFVRVSITGRDVTDKDILRLAERIGFQVEITTTESLNNEGDTKSISTAFNSSKAIRSYVQLKVRSERTRNKLESLGNKLYEGDTS